MVTQVNSRYVYRAQKFIKLSCRFFFYVIYKVDKDLNCLLVQEDNDVDSAPVFGITECVLMSFYSTRRVQFPYPSFFFHFLCYLTSKIVFHLAHSCVIQISKSVTSNMFTTGCVKPEVIHSIRFSKHLVIKTKIF